MLGLGLPYGLRNLNVCGDVSLGSKKPKALKPFISELGD